MADVHPSAVVDDSAVLAGDVRVGPHAVIEAGVRIGANTRVEVGTVLRTGTVVGARCRLGPYATVGEPPMDHEFRGEDSWAVLEDDVELREFTSVHRATGEGAETRVGASVLVMTSAHVSHNVTVGVEAVITNAVQLGGHAEVGRYAVVGGGVLVHQFARVGELAMIGGGSHVNRDVLPFALARGSMARHYRLNRVGLARHGIDGDRALALQRALRALRRRDEAQLDALAAEWPEVARLRTFRDDSRRGVARFAGA